MSNARFLGAALACLMAGCTVGPDFEAPKAPAVSRYDAVDAPVPTPDMPPGTAQQRFVSGEVPAQWWGLFRSPMLDALLRQAVSANNTLAAAKLTLASAQEAVAIARAAYLPRLDLSAAAQRRDSIAPGAQGANQLSIGPTASYTIDLFGATARAVEQQQALAANQGYLLDSAYLTLTGNAVTQSITIAASRLEIATLQDLIASDEKNLALVRREFAIGKAAQTDILTAESQLAGDRTQMPSLQQQLSVAGHALAILVGEAPGNWTVPDFDINDFTLPRDIPVALPSDLVHRRPDILASEAVLHADSAAIGVAVAQFYPSLTLSASFTQQSDVVRQLFQSAGNAWDIAAGLTVPIYHGGALEAQERQATDTFKAQFATYRQVVLTAFDQVADDLRALDHDHDRLIETAESLRISREALRLQRISYEAGKTAVLQLIDAERTYAQARLSFVEAQVQQLLDTASLFVALGGGWWGVDDDSINPAHAELATPQ
jgi:NodT family efflux transporter outer membrane factor (OMF) lipoprotein